MIRGYSAEQIRAAEEPHLKAGEPLMKLAAAGLASVIRDELAALDEPVTAAGVLLLVGSGNNGGDALFAGAELAASGCHVVIAQLGSRVHEAGLQAALAAGGQVAELGDDPVGAVLETATDAHVVVDGILGTGAHGSPALRGTARDVVAALRPLVASPRRRVVAVDLPSGVDVDTGDVPDETVLPADVTVTFGAHKAGLLHGPATAYVGRLVLVDIGLSADLEGVEPLYTAP
ncbi:NAD(P)H-hydrate epimerase [Rathayibacter sp. KR2-224]|uniref:NAD(P)H-hydrate epimerase n=1 Tax=Rathayibacter sp. KR2-224 TaxID=3400913 RepID=UPI003C02E558